MRPAPEHAAVARAVVPRRRDAAGAALSDRPEVSAAGADVAGRSDLPGPRPPVVPREAGAVLVVRDGAEGLEVLLGRRSTASLFLPGFWVFPGGRVEPGDGAGDGRWRAAAVREVREEVGLELDPATLRPFDRWLTPEGLPRRFDTVFFLAPVRSDTTPEGDAHEIDATRWTTPGRLLRDADDGLPVLAFPTLEQARRLGTATSVAEALAGCGAALPATTVTTIVEVDGLPAMHVAGPDGIPRRFREGPVHPNELAQRPPR